jgi:secreted trypsin-like serine protease
MKSLIIIFLTSFLLAFAACDEEISSNIVGGVDTSILDHPYMAKVHVRVRDIGWWPFCGATIINRRSILTAAHCLGYDDIQVSADNVRVSVGSSYRNGTNGIFYDAFRLIRHPQYWLGDNIQNDVAVIRLRLPLVYSRVVQPIPLGSTPIRAGDMLMVTGNENWRFFDKFLSENIFTKAGDLLEIMAK